MANTAYTEVVDGSNPCSMPRATLSQLKEDKTNVGAQVSMKSFGNIDAITGSFCASFQLHLWLFLEETVGKDQEFRPSLDPADWFHTSTLDCEVGVHWNTQTALDEWTGGKHLADGWTFICMTFKGSWRADFDLKHFPFDVQNVAMSMRFDMLLHPRRLFLLEENKWFPCKEGIGLDAGARLTSEEWAVFNPRLMVMERHVVDPFADDALVGFAANGNDRSRLCIALTIGRSYGSYVRSVYFPCGCAGLMTFLLFASPVDDSGSKIGNGLTLQLTIIALRFVIDAMLPKVRYAIAAEKYILFTFGFAFLTTCCHAFAGRYCLESKGSCDKTVEAWMFVCQFSAFFMVNIVTVISECAFIRRTRRGLNKAV